VKGYRGKTNFGGDYGEYLTDQNLRLDILDVEISLIDNGLSLPQTPVPTTQLVQNPAVSEIFRNREISPFWLNKLENFLDREQQIRSRLNPLELDTDSLGQGQTLDLMFDRVRDLVQNKKHIDRLSGPPNRPAIPFDRTEPHPNLMFQQPKSYQPEQIPEIASAIKTKQEIGPKPKKRRKRRKRNVQA